ncbi:MAG: methyltransferase [Alphaproteobacteria bacterium]
MLTRSSFPLLTALVTLAILAVAHAADRWALAVYALSFWHFLVYALAFLWRRIAQRRFMQDSVLLKGLSLAAFCAVLAVTLPNLLSLIVMAAGFALNISAARALGAERTYYGYELSALPPKRVTAFPYSLTAHPMLLGNMLAYGGTLLDTSFRQNWWPLGVLHVVLNLLIILNEAYGKESRSAGMIVGLAGLAAGAALLLVGFWDVRPYALLTVLIGALFGIVIMRRYA